jgi:hypothetical protein
LAQEEMKFKHLSAPGIHPERASESEVESMLFIICRNLSVQQRTLSVWNVPIKLLQTTKATLINKILGCFDSCSLRALVLVFPTVLTTPTGICLLQ